MELACAVLSSTALIGTAAASARRPRPQPLRLGGPRRRLLPQPRPRAPARSPRGACADRLRGAPLGQARRVLPHGRWPRALQLLGAPASRDLGLGRRAAYAVGLYCYLAKRCPPEESCVR